LKADLSALKPRQGKPSISNALESRREVEEELDCRTASDAFPRDLLRLAELCIRDAFMDVSSKDRDIFISKLKKDVYRFPKRHGPAPGLLSGYLSTARDTIHADNRFFELKGVPGVINHLVHFDDALNWLYASFRSRKYRPIMMELRGYKSSLSRLIKYSPVRGKDDKLLIKTVKLNINTGTVFESFANDIFKKGKGNVRYENIKKRRKVGRLVKFDNSMSDKRLFKYFCLSRIKPLPPQVLNDPKKYSPETWVGFLEEARAILGKPQKVISLVLGRNDTRVMCAVSELIDIMMERQRH